MAMNGARCRWMQEACAEGWIEAYLRSPPLQAGRASAKANAKEHEETGSGQEIDKWHVPAPPGPVHVAPWPRGGRGPGTGWPVES